MKIYQKTLLGVLVTVVALTGSLAILWRTVLLESYKDFEARDTRRNLDRAASALQDRIANINSHLNDWAAWDPTYRYMEDRDQLYLSDNFAGPVTLRDLGVSLMAYVAPDGELVKSLAIDPDSSPLRYVPLPPDLLPHLAPGRPLVTLATPTSRASGILLLKQGPLLLASQPIVRGSHEGPIRGVLVWGRFLTSEEIKQVADTTHLSVNIRRLDDPAAPEDMRKTGLELTGVHKPGLPVRALSDDQVAGYQLLSDIYGKPALIMRVDTSRSIFQQGLSSAEHSLATLVGACLVFGLVVTAMLRWLVLKRLARLSAEVAEIGALGNAAARVSISGRDELGTLATSINEMLSQIECSQEAFREAEALRRSEEQYRGLVDSSPMSVLIVREGELVFANDAAVRLTGAGSAKQLIGRAIRELLPIGPFPPGEALPLAFRKEMTLQQLTGEMIAVELVGSSITLGRSAALQLVIQDISERKQAEERLNFLAYHDFLTGLPNHLMFAMQLEQAIARARERGEQVLVMMLDLDRIKEVNDVLGTAGGDRLMIEIADRLRSAVRSSDVVARSSGDEFYLFSPQPSTMSGADQMARRLLDLFTEPIRIDVHEFPLSPSIGMSIFPADGDTGEVLARNAHVALYRARANGGNSFQYFDPALGEALSARRTLQRHLRKALPLGEFELFYQPQVDIQTRQVTAAEALLRWRHPELGMVPPGQFIPIAEESGLIIPLTDWVLRAACEQSRAWREAGHPLRLAINLSARHFLAAHQQSLIRQVNQLLDEFQVPPDQLELEITEGTAIQNLDYTAAALRQLDEMGVLLSIDDFGTGYSSLSYLGRLPVHTLKIDRSFVDKVESHPDNQAVIEAILAMAHALRLKVVAEGVETACELQFLKTRNCDVVQGYFFSRPLNAIDFARWLQEWQATNPSIEPEIRVSRLAGCGTPDHFGPAPA